MKKYLKIAPIAALIITVLLTQCKKADLDLNGSSSTAAFTFVQRPASDTLPYPYTINFTSTGSEGFLYQWNFGDGSNLSSEKNPSHAYAVGGAYTVSLTTVGTNGSNTTATVVGVIDGCANATFNKLTKCAEGEWAWSSDADAIKVLSPDATQVFFAGAAAPCQADDVYKFNKNGTFTYDAKGQTFSVQNGYSCIDARANATKYKLIAKAGQTPKILLDSTVTGGLKPFIGTTDVVDSNQYKIQSITDDNMVLRGVIAGSGGQIIEIKLKKLVALDLAGVKDLLTGPVSKSWRLDPTTGANPIVVGTEGNPTEYFAGGPLDTNCQSDDIFTFKASNQLTYNANGATFNGGNIAPNYNCGSDRSYTDAAFTFSATTGGVAGRATIQLSGSIPNRFIGVTDVPAENTYRIIDISTTKMTLRAGNGTGTVFTFKFIAL